MKKQWCINQITPRFLWKMEDVLHLYSLPYNRLRPLITFDERPCQLIFEEKEPLEMKAGKPRREDYHYKRNGTANLLVAYEPLTGQRHVKVTKKKTQKEYAQFMSELAEIHYPSAKAIVLVQDNLSTHSPSAFYKHLSAQRAFELSQKLEMHYTPKGASWLNMVEIEISAISRQCLKRRIPDQQTLEREVSACVRWRNDKEIKVNWQFTVNKARETFGRFYPNP